ncbi:MAG: preprotein translocase subunit SecE [Chloroflexota bacterium]|nr:preprotein translocase subunit SecE [Chloroflexota bacterium]
MSKKGSASGKKWGSGVVRYLRGVRAEVKKIVWPSQGTAIKLTLIVLGVTAFMSIALGLIDWIFAKLFALIVA